MLIEADSTVLVIAVVSKVLWTMRLSSNCNLATITGNTPDNHTEIKNIDIVHIIRALS